MRTYCPTPSPASYLHHSPPDLLDGAHEHERRPHEQVLQLLRFGVAVGGARRRTSKGRELVEAGASRVEITSGAGAVDTPYETQPVHTAAQARVQL